VTLDEPYQDFYHGSCVAKPDSPHAGLLVAGVVMIGVVAVPFGLMLGGLLPSELEAPLVMLGAVGIQLILDITARVAKLLPFWGPRQLLEGSLGDPFPHRTPWRPRSPRQCFWP
jgi:hypothetical protein